jgi:CSLREA domain-containing protein
VRAARTLLIAVVAALALPSAASAAPFQVNTTADTAPDKACTTAAGGCTLREAVQLAGNADTINVPAGTYTLTRGELALFNDHIAGAGARTTAISGNNASRVFSVTGTSNTVSGVTIRNGNGAGTTASGSGGGVFIAASAVITISNSTVSANTASIGGGIAVAGTLGLSASTVSGNIATTTRLARGGGLAVSSGGGAAIVNATISGNTAVDTSTTGNASEGGGIWSNGGLAFNGVTIANNTAATAGGLLASVTGAAAPPARQIFNTILSGNAGAECAGNSFTTDTTRNNVSDDTTCSFTAATDRQGFAAALGSLANNGGNTNTHALLPASPAINNGASCATTDQRGVARPQPKGGQCDVGAYEYRAPTLRVVGAVINDALGPLTVGQMVVHVRENGADIKGSPAAGVATPGRTYTLVAGSSYTVDANAVNAYTLSYSGDCTVTLAEGDIKTCTVTANDVAPTLRVITEVLNNNGGTAEPDDFSTHVRLGPRDVAGSPQPGNANGTVYALQARSYAVSAEGVPEYSASVTGDCAENGTITLQVGETKVCTVTADDGAPTLNVVTQVINDNGGTRAASDFSVHVRDAGLLDVTGSPQAGSGAGTQYPVEAGSYNVSAPMPGYTTTTSGDCQGDGTITLALGESRTCTVTANDVAPTLKVITTVVNDSGGTRAPSGFTVHVRRSGADVAGSPKPGSSSGTTYTLSAGTYAVGPDSVVGYTSAVGGACAANGSVTLQPGDAKTCTVSGNDNAIVRQQQLPPPQPGKNVNALPKGGTVLAKLPGTDKFVLLDEDQQIPLGTVVDVRKGRVTIVAAAGDDQAADFYGGIFKLGQTKGSKPITVLTLVEKLSCPKKSQATAAAKKKKKRRLWGDGRGRFRTKGRHSAATVVGTKWLVEDKCTSTTTRVVRGKVRVRDFVKKKNVLVKAGKKYVARARR